MNLQRIAILTDSCADIPQEEVQRHSLFVVPLKIIFSDGVFSDGVDITPHEIYARLPREVPKTSLPDGETVLRIFSRIRQAGYRKVLAINFSSGLSGTHQLIKRMGAEFDGLEVAAFDTLSGSLGTGAIVLQTAEYVEQNRSWDEILALIPRLIANTRAYFSVDTLEYIKKGGRIGLITAVAGTMLQIKPIISFAPDGELTSVEKVRGRRASLQKLVEMAVAQLSADKRYNIMWAHGEAPEDGETVKKMLEACAPKARHCYWGEVDCTLATHVGPHLVGAGVQILDADM